MEARIIRAGVSAAVVGLFVGAAFGSFGGWSPVLSLAKSFIGFWLLAIVLSIVLSYIYVYWFNGFLPGTAAVRGAIFGVLLWILLLILGGVSSFFKAAVYPNPAGTSLFLSLILNLVWGTVLGLVYESSK